ncbi:hypothetical protein QN363_10445 [Undibacterium sp. CCC2.1]|uniref:hypothetical protein n=1 Tax=unclassified Undibacterium TaxID=2630295 RepID=UPI002B232239|nr:MULTISPECIES: hypothetical protein [unclassified Undibacterium]MEB0139445.1 hypothetical protein [Undibacterium sp. CCC2.1]MEB0171673.1 hypothetical protein [Undibacterium sp. CCC1.1]MEB0176189.1 hypothetical protein [Undibacterium sp. CCC3.4]MEB0215018.1 hypothetical protein [Undibacterium sp. 5I2]
MAYRIEDGTPETLSPSGFALHDGTLAASRRAVPNPRADCHCDTVRAAPFILPSAFPDR